MRESAPISAPPSDSVYPQPRPAHPAPDPTDSGGWEPHSAWQRSGHNGLAWVGTAMPGVGMAAVLGVLATALADWLGIEVLGYAKSPISPILVTVLFGLAVRNTVGLPAVYDHGLSICVKQFLRVGVALLGIRLSLVEAGVTGLIALPIVAVTITAAFVVVTGLGRALGLPRRLATLITIGTSVCGITAIVALSPVIKAEEDETSYAVATIAAFGMVAMLVYPFMAHFIFSAPYQAGLFLGTSIHDTSQVAGAGLTYQQQFGEPAVLDTAVVAKLVRNLCMIAIIPLMGMLYHRHSEGGSDDGSKAVRWRDMVPLFILGFLAMTVIRTLGDLGERPFGFLSLDSWARVISIFQRLAEIGLLLAMAGVGLGTNLRRMRSLGLRPLSVGLVAAVCVGLASYLAIRLLVSLELA
jgi:uncharacterized integral membrane protein (TIGR00698 family)